MKLAYVADIRLPTEKAHGVQIMKMCEAFAKEGADVELVVPRRRLGAAADPFTFYGVERNFAIARLPTVDLVGVIPRFGFWLEATIFSIVTVLYLFFKKDIDVVYSRDKIPLFFLSFFVGNLYWEVHSGSRGIVTRRVLRCVQAMIAISQGVADFYERCGVAGGDVLIAHDAVDLAVFDVDVSRKEAREQIGLQPERRVVGYIGKLKTMGENKGVEGLIDAFSRLSLPDVVLLLVGINEDEVSEVRAMCDMYGVDKEDCRVVTAVPHTRIPFFLKACDLLVMNYPDQLHYARFMSPMKMFEYMSAGRPIVSTKLPTVQEILTDGRSAILVKPDDPMALADGMRRVLDDTEMANTIAAQALKDVQTHTWQKRAQDILHFIKKRP